MNYYNIIILILLLILIIFVFNKIKKEGFSDINYDDLDIPLTHPGKPNKFKNIPLSDCVKYSTSSYI
tara:strand:- start:276 stop:476 length:201 start_codon:yes stop_codon:yes gene_type:complete